jgi:hypothetical protein
MSFVQHSVMIAAAALERPWIGDLQAVCLKSTVFIASSGSCAVDRLFTRLSGLNAKKGLSWIA